MSENNPFSEDYKGAIVDQQTGRGELKVVRPDSKRTKQDGIDTAVDSRFYSDGKPRRVVIRAKIL